MKTTVIGAALLGVLAACGGGNAVDDLKPKAGGYSAVGEERMAPADSASASASASSSSSASPAAAAPATSSSAPVLDGADFVAASDKVIDDLKTVLAGCNRLDSKTYVAGSITIKMEVASDGSVTSAMPADRVGLNDDIETCLRRVALGADFAKQPAGKTAKFDVPMSFSKVPAKKKKGK